MFSKILIVSLLVSGSVFASYEAAERNYGKGSIAFTGYRGIVLQLVKGGHYASVVPWIKDYLVRANSTMDAEMEAAFDEVVLHTGVKIFESLPEQILSRSRSGNIKYILAKRLLQKDKNHEALTELATVGTSSLAYPFVANLRGTIHAANGNFAAAESEFRECVRASERMLGRSDSRIQRNQMETNRDYCTAGIGRVHFAAGKHRNAENYYLDISKDSFVWPEILFDEAWASYYLKNYNRTLGKLVSYRAPVFDFVFNPEVDVLKGLTYLKMCLYDDAKKTVDGFYDQYLTPSRELRRYLLSHGKDYRYWYNLMADFEAKGQAPAPIVVSILKSIKKDPAYIEMKGAISSALAEFNELRKRPKSALREVLMNNVQTVLDEYRMTLGAYVRSGMVNKYAELYSAFQGMSYIKLEVLAQKKERLYSTDEVPGRKRGDVKYIERNDKQYFWTFNGEFWADELGDYVFALRSEC
jgi:hypothetical protein